MTETKTDEDFLNVLKDAIEGVSSLDIVITISRDNRIRLICRQPEDKKYIRRAKSRIKSSTYLFHPVVVSPHSRYWTQYEERKLKTLKNQSHSDEYISIVLNRSVLAIKSRWRGLKLKEVEKKEAPFLQKLKDLTSTKKCAIIHEN